WVVVSKSGAQVDFIADLLKSDRNESETAQLVTVFASLVIVNHVSRQSPNSRRRKRTAQGPGRVQARARREVRAAILYHELRWEGCTSLSLRGMGADRAEAGRALHFQSHEEEVSRSRELLGTASRDGRPGTPADAATVAGIGADQGRSGGHRTA